MEIVRLGAGDDHRVHDAAHLFDAAPLNDATARALPQARDRTRAPASAAPYGMFVLTDDDNPAALATYAVDGALREDGIVMFSWDPL